MTKREKRLQRIQQNPKNVSLDELSQLLRDYGFILARVTGSHHIFVAEIGNQAWKLTIPFNRPIKTIYVRVALEAITEVIAAQQEMVAEEDEIYGSDDNERP